MYLHKENLLRYMLLLAPMAIYWGFNYDNVQGSFAWVLAVLVLPYVVSFQQAEGGHRFGLLSLLFGLLLFVFRSNSFFYFSAVFLLLYILESWWGRLNQLPALLVLVVSPVIGHIVYIWSFPIRLRLSEWAAASLRLMQLDVTANGNMLTMDGNIFAVDPACIGLKMVVTGLVLSILIMGHFEKKHRQHLSFWAAGLLLAFVLLASVFSNFTRLLVLILFHILPENWLHELTGIFSMLLYVLLPFYFLAGFVFRKKWGMRAIQLSPMGFNPLPLGENAQNRRNSSITQQMRSFGLSPGIVILLLFLVWNGLPFLEEKVETFGNGAQIELPGFEKSATARGMLKFQNESALIYLKAPVLFFQGSHDPRFCWQGSGYDFSNVQLERIGGRDCYTAVLRKGEDRLYTAWWYTDGVRTTPYENWRWDSLRQGKGFSLVNVNCGTRADLEVYVGLAFLGFTHRSM